MFSVKIKQMTGVLILTLSSLSYTYSMAADNVIDIPDVQKFIKEMVTEHAFKQSDLETLFKQVEIK
ncbi:MAG: hypothetical protein KAI17_24380, partial [Thiotrichaceae bacterium]|nr:hypothetical protein [Thiotrichaceae bacterium]